MYGPVKALTIHPRACYCRSLIDRATTDVLHPLPRADKTSGICLEKAALRVKKDVLNLLYPAGNNGTRLTCITSLTSLSSDLAGDF